jgi:hypothetical protein
MNATAAATMATSTAITDAIPFVITSPFSQGRLMYPSRLSQPEY